MQLDGVMKVTVENHDKVAISYGVPNYRRGLKFRMDPKGAGNSVGKVFQCSRFEVVLDIFEASKQI